MPTYVCAVPPKLLSDEQKNQIAVAISHRHGEATALRPSSFKSSSKKASRPDATWAVNRPTTTSGFAGIFARVGPRKYAVG